MNMLRISMRREHGLTYWHNAASRRGQPDGGAPCPSAMDGARAVQVAFAAEQSARIRRPVTVPLLKNTGK